MLNFGTHLLKWFFLIVYTLISLNSFSVGDRIPVIEIGKEDTFYKYDARAFSSHIVQGEQLLVISKGKSQEPLADFDLFLTSVSNVFCSKEAALEEKDPWNYNLSVDVFLTGIRIIFPFHFFW